MSFFPLQMFNHTCYPQSQFLSVLVTVSVAFAQIHVVLRDVRSHRVWGEEPSGLVVGGCSSTSVLQWWLVKINCCFAAVPAFLPSLFPCLLPWWLGTAIGCVELTALSGRAIQGTLHTFSSPSPPTGSSDYERQLLCFSQSTAQHPGFWPVVALMHRSHVQMCWCAVWVFFVEF